MGSPSLAFPNHAALPTFALGALRAKHPTFVPFLFALLSIGAILTRRAMTVFEAPFARTKFAVIFALVILTAKFPAVIFLVLTLAWAIQAEFVRAILVVVRAIGIVFAFTAKAQDASIRHASGILAAFATVFTLLAADLEHIVAELGAFTIAVATARTKAHRLTIPVNTDLG